MLSASVCLSVYVLWKSVLPMINFSPSNLIKNQSGMLDILEGVDGLVPGSTCSVLVTCRDNQSSTNMQYIHPKFSFSHLVDIFGFLYSLSTLVI